MAGGRAVPWETGNGTIPIGNVINAVKLPASRTQIVTGLPVTGAWTVVARTNPASLPTGFYLFDSETGRVFLAPGVVPAGYSPQGTNTTPLLTTGDHTYMLVSSGTQLQAYRDNAAIDGAVNSTVDIGGVTRWGSRYTPTGGVNWFDWPVPVPGAAIYNIALDSTQRAALHTSLMALPAS